MRVIVVGAGIGGLSVAIGLRRDSHEVVVLEQAPRLDAIGAGITLFRNAMRALDRLGVGADVAARGAAARSSMICTADGRELARFPADLLEGAIAIHRADLQDALAAAAGDVRLGARIATVEQDDAQVVVRDDHGNEDRAELVIGADGLHSVVRGFVAAASPRYGGYTAWRGVARTSIEAGHLSESWGNGERFGLVDIGGGHTYWFATKNARQGQADDAEGRKAELRRRFAGWHEPIAAIIDATDDAAILRNDVYDLPILSRWHDRRVVLLGDAAHATTPGVGQGAAQAIEDAVVLTAQLASDRDVETALESYERLRRPRTEFVQTTSRRVDRIAQLDNAMLCRMRNAVFPRIPERVRRRQFEPLVNVEL
jgi:2-polyprenyl-6-methoxyphenol hydroxylase-like FAD-dependent oxidoreductase